MVTRSQLLLLLCVSGSLSLPLISQIRVGQPRVYDERALRKKLADLEEQLRAVNAIDPSKLDTARVQGVRQSGFSLSLSATTLPTPGIKETRSNTTNTGTINTIAGEDTTVSVDSEKPSVTTTRSTKPTVQNTGSTVATTGREVTTPSVAPTIPAVVASGASLPAGGPAFGLSAADVLDAQMNLSYQIINTRLALEGAVTDRLRTFGTTKDGKPFRYTALSTVLGIPISIDEECKDCVAEIDVFIASKPTTATDTAGQKRLTIYSTPAQQVGQAPIEVGVEQRDTRVRLVSLLPREKVYNVATVSERNIAVGAAALVSVVNIGGSGLWSRKRAYLVKDIDTIARDLTGPSTMQGNGNKGETSDDATSAQLRLLESPNAQFGWQFRPVLGRRTVEGRLREVLVVLSLPISDVGSETWEGVATVQTRWRRYDSKNGIAGAVIREYPSARYPVEVFPNALLDTSLGPKISQVSVEEGSNGRFGVAIYGTNFDDALSVQAGDARVDAKSGLIVDSNRVSFVVDAAVLAGSGVSLIGRYGSTAAVSVNEPSKGTGLRIVNADVCPVERDNLSVRLRVSAQDSARPPELFGRSPMVLAGGHVFGTRASPLADLGVHGETHDYQFHVAVGEIRDNPLVTIRLPLQADVPEDKTKGTPLMRYAHSYPIVIPHDFTADAPIVISVDHTTRRYAIVGSGFVDGMKVQVDASGCSKIAVTYKTPQLLVLELSPECAVSAKYVILAHPRNTSSQALLKLPGGAALPSKITGQDTVKVGDIKTFTIAGTRMDKVFEVRFHDKQLAIDKDSDDNKLMIQATEELTKTEGGKELRLYCSSGEVLKFVLKVSR